MTEKKRVKNHFSGSQIRKRLGKAEKLTGKEIKRDIGKEEGKEG